MRSGELIEFKISFHIPPVETRAVLLRHSQRVNEVLVVLHGHTSSADSVVGRSKTDYMRQIGNHYFGRGFDILAFDLTSHGSTSSYINSQLSLWGGQVYGLWSRSVCDTVEALDLRSQYDRVIVYGLSNGGVIADYISVLCKPFTLVIVDDILQDWRLTVWQNPRMYINQQYGIYYLRPFLNESTFMEPMVHSRSRKVYIVKPKVVLDELKTPLETVFSLHPLDKEEKVSVVFKGTNKHTPEFELLDALLVGDYRALDGLSLVPR